MKLCPKRIFSILENIKLILYTQYVLEVRNSLTENAVALNKRKFQITQHRLEFVQEWFSIYD
jgi:hypothetical protein